MNNWRVTAVAVPLLTALSFFVFPGHTILQSDTQIYIPILEHLADPSVLSKDIMASRPHVTFTIYDEMALGLRAITGLSFEHVLMGQQFVYRAIAIFGLYLLAASAGLSAIAAWLVSAIISLGAAVIGPAVLIVEYEPVPRGFALPFVVLSLAMVARKQWNWAALTATIGFAFHPPTAFAYCALLFLVLVWNAQAGAVAMLAAGPLLLAVTMLIEPRLAEAPPLFGTIDPALESLQRTRASYNWVSIWVSRWIPWYFGLWAVSLIAWWQVRGNFSKNTNIFLVGLPIIGMVSVPASYLLLEEWKWVVIPQFQPGRNLLFVVMLCGLLCCLAAVRAASERKFAQAALFLVAPIGCSAAQWDYETLIGLKALPVIGLAMVVVASLWSGRAWAVASAAIAPFVILPFFVQNYAPLHTPELNALSKWAEESTPKEALFQFADVGRRLEAGVFRARAKRALYADWKGGGQVNFLQSFATEWSDRWKIVSKQQPVETYRDLHIDYVIFQRANKQAGYTPVYENAAWVVYDLKSSSTSVRVGIDAWAPNRVTEIAAAALANRNASSSD